MNDVKPWYLSKSVWGAVITIVAAAAGTLNSVDGVSEQEITTLVESLVGLLGGAIALYGRLKATHILK